MSLPPFVIIVKLSILPACEWLIRIINNLFMIK